MEALSFAVLVVILCLQSTDAACPAHCKAGQTCNSADSGCAECEQAYYGRQCQHRMQCRYTVKESEYRGTKNKTMSGRTCQRWDSDTPHGHNYHREEENYCRTPDGDPEPEPWCYTADPDTRWELCGIPKCDTQCLAPKLDVPFIDITNPPDDGFVVGFVANIAVVCGSGYEPQDGLTAAATTCQNDKTWSSNTLPSCRKIQCSVSLLPNNSKIINEMDKYEYEDIIIIGCNTGYTLEGNNTLVCLANTSWSHRSTTCQKIQCQLPTLPDNSTLRNAKEKYEYLDNITFACNYGYRLKGDNEMTCQSDKNWSTPSGSCKKIQCQSPTLPDNSTLENAKDKYEYLDNITFVCNHGYRLQGNNEMTCQSNNRWSTPSGSCKSLCPSNCSPGQICVSEDNGCSDCDKAYYGRQCQHRMQCRYTDKGVEYRGTKNETKSGKTCQRWASDTPHKHKRHDNEENYCRNFNKSSKPKPWCFTSDAKKRWELCDIPKCDSQCPAPNLDSSNVDITNPPTDGFSVGFTANIDIRCDTGYQTNGQVSTTCQSNKTWSSTTLPVCIKIQCSKSLLPNNSKIINEMDKYEYEDIITIGCNTGYTLEGNNTLDCLDDKSWSNPSTTCNKNRCQLPTLPYNSKLGNTKKKYEYLDIITFVCNHGYRLQGNNEMTCQSNKTWSTPSGSCESLCPSNCKPGQICVSEDNGCSDCDQAYYGRQCQHRMQCRYTDKGVEYRGTKNETKSGRTCQHWALDTPHEHSNNDRFKDEENYCRNFKESPEPEPWCYTTDTNTRWDLCDIPKCDSQCTPPNLDAPNVDITNPPADGFSVGFIAVIDVRCNTGYQTKGQVSTTCQSNKTWSSTTLPICIKIQCSRSLLPQNSKIINETDKYEYEDIITIGCNTGYALEGNNTLVCLADTSWSHPSTTCKKIQCSRSLLPHNSKIINEMDKYEYEDTITIVCNTGYTLEGNNTLVCLADKSWSHPSTTCKINQCSVPHLNARSNITQPKSVYAYSEVVTIFCESGYVLQGSYQLTCLANRTWNFELPTCTRIKCIELELSTHLSISQPIASEFKYGDIVSFKCKEGYKLNHSESLQCQANSRWSKVVPSCRQTTETDNVGAIVGGTFGVLGVAVVVIVILFLLRRKRKSFKKQDDFVHVHLNDLENLGNIERGLYVRSTAKVIYGREKLRKKEKPEESGHNVYENIGAANANVEKEEAGPSSADNTYCNIQDAQNIGKIINIENLKNYIRVKKDDLHFFEEEFKTFPIGLQRPAQAAMRPKNRPKNKYKNIYPYDDNRIKLTLQQGVADSDFINASKIKGFNGKTKYIAAQGPQDATHVDFWRMIYEQRIRNIVMLTNVFEGGIKKCIQYWPDEEIYEAGAITVELQSSDKFADYTIRRLKLIKDDDITFVCQHHFTTWPDKGVPKCPCVLAQFHKKVFDILGQDDIPIVIHCSAGIGRTGTFIALDYLLDEAGKTGNVGISKALETLREQRVNMVQTKEQYAFLHDALVDALELRTSVVKVVEFSDKYKRRLVRNKTTGKFLLQEEFESINESTSYLKADAYTVGKREENKPKNRFNNILPTDVNRVHLSGQTADESYINAVYLPGYRNGYAYIITQAPLSNTIEDFWKLIFDEKIASIVALNQNTNVDEVYWPDDEREPREYGDFNISLICKDDEIGFQCLTYQICHKKEKHVVKQFKINFWPDTDTTPSTTAPMLKLIDNVQMQQNGTTPILVHCMNGADKSGLFCTAMALLGKLKGDEEISVQSLVKQMKSIRPQIVPNVEQYQYCYDLLGMYISSFETYSNFS